MMLDVICEMNNGMLETAIEEGIPPSGRLEFSIDTFLGIIVVCH